MTELDVFLTVVSVLAFGCTAYLAGKGDLLNLIPLMLLEKAKEIEDRLKDGESE